MLCLRIVLLNLTKCVTPGQWERMIRKVVNRLVIVELEKIIACCIDFCFVERVLKSV